MTTDKHRYAFSLAVATTCSLLGFAGGSATFYAAGQRTYGDSPRAVLISTYDGDTFTVDIPSWPKIVGEKIGVRVLGVDCPEMKSRDVEVRELARQAKEFTDGKLRLAKRIELHDLRRDKYFRIVSEVVIYDRARGGKGERLSEALLAAGLAKEYDGGTKDPWED